MDWVMKSCAPWQHHEGNAGPNRSPDFNARFGSGLRPCSGLKSALRWHNQDASYEIKGYMRWLFVRGGTIRSGRAALQHYALPLPGLPQEQRSSVCNLGVVQAKRGSIHYWRTAGDSVGWTSAFILSGLRHVVDIP